MSDSHSAEEGPTAEFQRQLNNRESWRWQYTGEGRRRPDAAPDPEQNDLSSIRHKPGHHPHLSGQAALSGARLPARPDTTFYNAAADGRFSERKWDAVPRRPKRLSKGDTLGIVSPSSPSSRDSDLERLRRWAAEHELSIKEFEHARDRFGYLAGSDVARAHDITAAFADAEVDAVVTMRGGTGGWRMVPHVDYEVVRANPKLFIGYSDITALHLAIGARSDLVTFYGPSGSSFIGRGASHYTLRHFLRAACDPAPLGEIEKDPDDPFTWSISPGVAEGPLRGGCLTLLTQSLGTPWEVDWDGCIVFVEDVNEEPYRIDGYLTQLKLAGKLDAVAGFVVGEHVDCGPRQFRPSYAYGTFSTEEVYRQHLEPLGVPVMVGLPCGHGKHLATLPLGVRARLDADRLTLEVLEAATE